MRVRYATVEDFTADFVRSIRRGKGADFRRHFRDADVLLIDDIQFLADKMRPRRSSSTPSTRCTSPAGNWCITSDRSPNDLEEFEARLTERFASGLVAELRRPASTYGSRSSESEPASTR